MTAATSATVRKVTSFSPASMAACEAVARGVLGAFLPAPTAFAAVGLPGLELLDVLMGHQTFGTCRCAGFPTGERDTHVLDAQ